MIEINVREDNLYRGEPRFFSMLIDPAMILTLKPYRFLAYDAMRARNPDVLDLWTVEPLPDEILGTGCQIFTRDDKFIYVTDSYESLRDLIKAARPLQ